MRSVAHHSELWGLTRSRGLTLAKRGWLTHGYLHVSDLPTVTCPLHLLQSATGSCYLDPPTQRF